MDAPKNCLECEHGTNCKSYYGGTTCKHNEAINKTHSDKRKNQS